MQKAIYYCYKNHRVINPRLSRIKTVHYCLFTLRTLARERYDTFSFLLNDKKTFQSEIRNKKIIDNIYLKSGAVFITIHSSSYTLLGKIYSDYFNKRKLVVPYKAKIFGMLRVKLEKLGVKITPLGGAMKEIHPILSKGGSIVLYLDTDLPVNHKTKVNLFGRDVELTTGPLWLAKKYKLPIVPLYIERKSKKLSINVFEPIKFRNRKDSMVMQDIADAIERMILINLKSWHVYDAFLLGEEDKLDARRLAKKSVLYPLRIAPSLQKLMYLLIAFLGRGFH